MERRQKSREELILVATDRNAAIGNWSEFFNIAEHSFGMKSLLRIQFKLNTALFSHCPCVRVFVTGVTSHISHIYKGINAMLIIRGPIKPYIF